DLYCDIPGKVEMQPGHIFSTPPAITLDSYAVDEIEEEIELSTLADTLDIDQELAIKLLDHLANEERDFCLRFDAHAQCHPHPTAYLYICTDAVWFAVIPPDELREAVTESVIDYCRRADYRRNENN